MKRQGNMVAISPERLRLFCSKNGGQAAVSTALGYGNSFISNVLHSGKMNVTANKLLAATYGIPEDFFLAPEPPKVALPPEPERARQEGQDGYALRLLVSDKQVFCCLSTMERRSGVHTPNEKIPARWRSCSRSATLHT